MQHSLRRNAAQEDHPKGAAGAPSLGLIRDALVFMLVEIYLFGKEATISQACRFLAHNLELQILYGSNPSQNPHGLGSHHSVRRAYYRGRNLKLQNNGTADRAFAMILLSMFRWSNVRQELWSSSIGHLGVTVHFRMKRPGSFLGSLKTFIKELGELPPDLQEFLNEIGGKPSAPTEKGAQES